ncbi:MAG: hypothetical protein QXI49_05810 [Candidatus Methanomethylicaceae archaeon]
MPYSKSFKLIFTSFMLSLVYIFELLNRAIPLRAPWGMSIDFVAIPVIIVFFLFGIKYGLAASFGMFLILLAIGYGVIIGAVMKTVATISMILVLSAFIPWIIKSEINFKSRIVYLFGVGIALLVRSGVCCLLNYYWALPLFFNMSIEQIINTFFFGSIYGFIVFVSLMNITQGIVDLLLSWIIVFEIARRVIKIT